MVDEYNAKSLGPLPRADRNAELQRLSISALQYALPPEKFVFRDERVEDAGVDGSLELLIDSRYTNLRSQVQLKGTDSADTNSDGSVSIQVRVSNLNYLLNGPSPLYVLYIAPRNELRYVWARDERRRLDEANPEWMSQAHITIRFHTLLTRETVEEIHQRIQREARLQRELNDIIGRAGTAERIVISIAPETLNITDPDEARRILLASGTAIVSAGYTDEVKNLLRLLNPTDAQLPRILLVHAHVEYMTSRFHACNAVLADLSLRAGELSSDDRQFLKALRDGYDYQTGRIGIREFAARLQEYDEQGTGGFALSYRLNRLRYAALTERDFSRRDELLRELIALVEATESSDNSANFKLQARISLIEAQGYTFVLRSMLERGEAVVKMHMGRLPDIPAMVSAQVAQTAVLEQQMIGALRDAIDLSHPLLVADAIMVRASFGYHVLANHRALALLTGRGEQVSDDRVEALIGEANKAAGIFSRAKQLEGELRAKMLIADLHELAGREDEARGLAQEVLPQAQAMGYAIIVARAEEHLSGQGLLRKMRESTKQKTEEENLIRWSEESDDEVRYKAAQGLRILELPPERLPVVEREYFSIREVSRERVNWCRHIDLIQDKRHTRSRDTFYRTDPERFCICHLYGYRSSIGNPDWAAIISAFKRAYCEGCPGRNPIR